MPYNEKLNDRVREAMSAFENVTEKRMFGGICYMLNDKMCLGLAGDELMCRIGPDEYEAALEQRGCREMVFTGRPMKGYVYVSDEGLRSKQDLDHWIGLCVAFNKEAKSSKKKNKKKNK